MASAGGYIVLLTQERAILGTVTNSGDSILIV